MGFWQMVAKGMLDKAEYDRVTKQQQAHDAQMEQYRGPGLFASMFAGRRANRWADRYAEENERIAWTERPLSHRFNSGFGKSELGHPPGCGCGWC